MRDQVDREGKNEQERFVKIREFFLASLEAYGNPRKELYHKPKPGDAREPTEEEVVRRWAGELRVPLNDILVGIQRAFQSAAERGAVVTSFRYCVPQVMNRQIEMKESRVGSGY